MMTMTYDDLLGAVAGTGVGVRSRTRLEPLGGAADKVFPPTYGVPDQAETRSAMEKRREGGKLVDAVVLDSVASQANRFELGLLDAYRAGELSLPVLSVDFRPIQDLSGFDRISSLEASHRVFDALLRDSLLDGMLFRLSEVGRKITEASPRNAAALFPYSPTTLLFGGWDSTGPKGGRGAKYERCITSEVVAIGVQRGVKTASRIDPAGIEKGAGTLYEADDGTWTLDEARAKTDSKGNPKKLGKAGEAGRPSQANLGNVVPSIDPRAGGITADRIEAVTVLSFPAIRRLRFPIDVTGAPIPSEHRRQADAAAHTALAALGLAGAVLAFEEGFDLRSRCVLVSTGPLEFELLSRTGGEPDRFSLDRKQALELVERSCSAAADRGLTWLADELLLQPADRLAQLIRRSRALAEPEAS